MSGKPESNIYFVGLGHAPKDLGGNYISQAQKVALQDLISEIRVNVSSTSVLSLIDTDQEFRDEYQSMIKTQAEAELEDHELVDSWEDQYNYWVYYRLSRARWAEIQEEKRRNANMLALDFYDKGMKEAQEGNVSQAMRMYVRALISLSKYLGEPNQNQYKGNTIFLGNELYLALERLMNGIEIKVPETRYNINRRLEKGKSVPVQVLDAASGKPLEGIPLKAEFSLGSGLLHREYTTDDQGRAIVILTRIDSRENQQKIVIKPDVVRMAENGEPDLLLIKLLEKVSVPNRTITLDIMRPVVYMTSIETELGKESRRTMATNKLRHLLTDAGFTITDSRDEAELWLDLKAGSEEGPVSGSIYITYVNLSVSVQDLKRSREVYNTSLNQVRGYSLDYQRSSAEGFSKCLEILENEKVPELINAMLQ